VKLFEHRDFQQAILQAADHFKGRGLRPAIIEKDYYVTEALRIIAAAGDKVIFKGGTSLAKGWNLIPRPGCFQARSGEQSHRPRAEVTPRRRRRWGQPYVDEGANAYETRYRQQRIGRLAATAKQLGYQMAPLNA